MRIHIRTSDVQSSNIDSMEYLWYSSDNSALAEEQPFSLKSQGFLRVTFQNRSRYVYENVPFDVWLNIVISDSQGEAFNSSVKSGGFKYYKEGSNG